MAAIQRTTDRSMHPGGVSEQVVALARRRFVGGSSVEPRIVERLVQRGVLSAHEATTVLERVTAGTTDLEALMLDEHGVPPGEYGAALSEVHRCPFVAYDARLVPDPALFSRVSLDYLQARGWIPLARDGGSIQVLLADPSDVDREDEVRRAFPKCTVQRVVGLRRDITRILQQAADQVARGTLVDILGELRREGGIDLGADGAECLITEHDSAIVRLAHHIVAEAYRLEASDIHIEPSANRKDTLVRLRVDGTCFTAMRIPAASRRAIVSRLKVLARLDIAERRKPQDGKIRYTLRPGQEVELRVATLPTAGGNEDMVLRLLTAKDIMTLETMDCAPEVLQHLRALAEHPYGLFLCVGPTGAGKTTMLHAVLKQINTDERKIWTAEDPIEITQEGLRQVQVQPKIGLTFAAAMRAFLRADPDVIMIGEMRDRETADIAIEASLTGHLVFSTLHTNNAVETVTRLIEMGCDVFNVADAMLGILAQRLCKRLCGHCKEPYHPTVQEYDELVQAYGAVYWDRLGVSWSSELTLYRGVGCPACNHTGFKGRVALHELLRGSEEICRLVQSKARTGELAAESMRQGMVTLRQHGIQRVLQGITTFRQVRAVANK